MQKEKTSTSSFFPTSSLAKNICHELNSVCQRLENYEKKLEEILNFYDDDDDNNLNGACVEGKSA